MRDWEAYQLQVLLWRVVSGTCAIAVVGDWGIGVGVGAGVDGIGDAAEDEDTVRVLEVGEDGALAGVVGELATTELLMLRRGALLVLAEMDV